MKNEETLASLIGASIDLIFLDYQILPKTFFKFFEVKNKIEKRVIDSRKARQYVTAKILEFLDAISMLHSHYYNENDINPALLIVDS